MLGSPDADYRYTLTGQRGKRGASRAICFNRVGTVSRGSAVTDSQRRLARHMLGLPNKAKRSYRNRFFAACGSPDYDNLRQISGTLRFPWGWQGGDIFILTRAGAEAVLERDEHLDPEDFP